MKKGRYHLLNVEISIEELVCLLSRRLMNGCPDGTADLVARFLIESGMVTAKTMFEYQDDCGRPAPLPVSSGGR